MLHDRTAKPTLRYRYFGGIQPMSEHDRTFWEWRARERERKQANER